MVTIRDLLVERLDKKIARLRRAKRKLQEKSLEDKKLEHLINGLLSMRNKLHGQDSTDG